MAIKNYLKDIKDVTAPLNWKSSPDSPPTQLAYVTKPEIDMLVKANIHGSMKGKPNKGPKGIISLDGFGEEDDDYVGPSKPPSSVSQGPPGGSGSSSSTSYGQTGTPGTGGSTTSSFDLPGAGSTFINNVDYGQAYEDEQNILGGTNNVVTDNQGNAINLSNPNLQPEGDKGKGTGRTIEDILSNTTFGQFVQGLDSTNRFFKNLAEEGVDGLSTEDKIILANLIKAGGLDTIDLNKYTTDDVDFEELGKRFTQAASGLENVDYESLVDSYLSNKPTGIDSLTTMGSDLFNLFGDPRFLREDGSYTLEGLEKELGPEGIAYLKANNPKLYYSFTDPQTSGGLEELAQFDLSTLGGSPEDRRLAARIMAAREATSGQGGQGVTSIPLPEATSGVITPTTPTTTYEQLLQQYGRPNLIPPELLALVNRPGIENIGFGIGSPKIPGDKMNIPAAFNYANMAPQFTGSPYTNQGVSPMLGDYYGNLRRYYG
jgi:hypothetical protein